MTSRLAAFIVAIVTTANCQTTPNPNGASHFYWSEAKAHELDYQHTIATATELSATERSDLLAFFLRRFQHPTNAHDQTWSEDSSADELRKLAADTRIELVDLNDDETREIIAQGNGLGPCGGTGNCLVMVLQSTPSGWKTLLDSHAQFDGGFDKIRVLDTSTNGYRDIVVADHTSACERTALVLAYDNNQYRQRECYHINGCTKAGTVRLAKPEIGVCGK